MRLLRFRDGSGTHVGVLHEEKVIALDDVAVDMVALIEMGQEGLDRVRSRADSSDGIPLDTVEVLAPLYPRGNVMAIGHNYQAHINEQDEERRATIDRPTVFTKAQTSVTGPFADIPIDEHVTQQVDWEAEMGVVIGRRGINIPGARAMEYVYGYTVINDVSARDVQFGSGGQFFRGKSLDSFCPMGPYLVTADEVPDPQDLAVRCWVNGVQKQDGNTRDMIFTVADLIAELSAGMTLEPGNVIATGTPEGVGYFREPKEFLHPDDVLETEVGGIGCLCNHVAQAGGSGHTA